MRSSGGRRLLKQNDFPHRLIDRDFFRAPFSPLASLERPIFFMVSPIKWVCLKIADTHPNGLVYRINDGRMGGANPIKDTIFRHTQILDC